jgi:uncharacterized protein
VSVFTITPLDVASHRYHDALARYQAAESEQQREKWRRELEKARTERRALLQGKAP